MKYKLTIEQADLKNIVKGLLESYTGADLFTDFRATVRDIIRDEYYRRLKLMNQSEVTHNLSLKYGVSIRYIQKCVYGK